MIDKKDNNEINSRSKFFKKILNRYFITGLSYMALGLFSSLIIGLILSQLSQIPFLSFLKEFSAIIGAKSPVVGAAIGCAIAYGFKMPPLVIFSSVATGAFGYSLGGPVGAFVASVVGAEFGNLVSGKTKVDIVVIPLTTIILGSLAGKFVGPPISEFMIYMGDIIDVTTKLHPIPMGILVAALMGMFLTAPISSAAIAISLGLDGLAAGAATVGCCAQMVGFAVMSFKSNCVGGLISQGLGTSMLQVSNIVKKPQIWIPPILAGAILGPISTSVFKMTNNPLGAGMGTSGLVGQFGTWASMSSTTPPAQLLIMILIMQIIAPALLTLGFYYIMKKNNWIKDEYLTLNL